MIVDLLYKGVNAFLKTIPILIFAVIIGQIILAYLPTEKIEKLLTGSGKNILIAAAIGLFSPGPNAAYLPILYALRSRGASLCVIVTFITSQTMVGPVRFFLEAEYFGVLFWLYRFIIAFFIAIAMGISFRLLGQRLEKRVTHNETYHFLAARRLAPN